MQLLRHKEGLWHGANVYLYRRLRARLRRDASGPRFLTSEARQMLGR